MQVLFIIFLILSILIGLPTVVFAVKLIVYNSKTAAKARGRVDRYKAEEVGSFFGECFHVWLPVFTFSVNGKEYGSTLRFSQVKAVDRPDKARVGFSSSGKPKQKISLYYDKEKRTADDDPLRDAFPYGYKGNVFYDPKDPEHNYAIRRPRQHPVFRFFLFLTVINIAMTVLFFCLSRL